MKIANDIEKDIFEVKSKVDSRLNRSIIIY